MQTAKLTDSDRRHLLVQLCVRAVPVAVVLIATVPIVWTEPLSGPAVVPAVLLAVVGPFLLWRALRVGQDLASGEKQIRVGRVDRKLYGSAARLLTSPVVRVGGEEFAVSRAAFSSIVVGQRVELHVAPRTRIAVQVRQPDAEEDLEPAVLRPPLVVDGEPPPYLGGATSAELHAELDRDRDDR